MRHTLIFCYGEENSAKKIRGGGKKSNLSKNILPCIYFIKFLICFMCKKNICTSFKSIIPEFSFVIHLLNHFFFGLANLVESKLIYLGHQWNWLSPILLTWYINRSIIKIESCKILASYDRPRTGCWVTAEFLRGRFRQNLRPFNTAVTFRFLFDHFFYEYFWRV